MWRVTIKGLLAHKLRLALTALSIVLGVTFIAGTFVLTDTLHNTFNTLFSNIYQNIDFQVRGVAQFGSGGTATRNPVPESVVSTVRAVPGVEAAERVGHWLRAVHLARRARRSRPVVRRRSAFRSTPTRSSRPLRLTQGTAPTTPNDVVMDLGTAQKYHFRVGQNVRILLEGPTRTFTITGLARFGTANNLAGATLAAFDIPTAQALARSGRSIRQHQRHRRPGCRQGDGAARHRTRPATRRRGGDRSDGDQRGDELHQPGTGLLQHRTARVRVHRALRGRLHHPQHVLHHCGPTHARAGAPPHRRCQPPPGLPLGDARGRRSWAWCRP